MEPTDASPRIGDPAAEPRALDHAAPILWRIVHGSSSTSLDLIRAATLRPRRPDAPAPRLLRARPFERTIIYKFPDFAAAGRERSDPRPTPGAPRRPIGTAIFVPDDPATPMAGGHTIHLALGRHRRHLREYLGIDPDAADTDPDVAHDMAVLRLLQDVPSLDPFLVRARLSAGGFAVEAGALALKAQEEAEIRRIVADKVGPILSKALGRDAAAPTVVCRTLDAMWDPRTPEAMAFVEAFRIATIDSADAAFAVQGIAYYQHLFAQARDAHKEVLDWLNLKAAMPTDAARAARFDMDRLHMLRGEIMRWITAKVQLVSRTFGSYDLALGAFVDRDDPSRLRAFLAEAPQTFWRLGHALTALANAHFAVQLVQRTAGGGTVDVAACQETLQRLRVALSDAAEAHAF